MPPPPIAKLHWVFSWQSATASRQRELPLLPLAVKALPVPPQSGRYATFVGVYVMVSEGPSCEFVRARNRARVMFLTGYLWRLTRACLSMRAIRYLSGARGACPARRDAGRERPAALLLFCSCSTLWNHALTPPLGRGRHRGWAARSSAVLHVPLSCCAARRLCSARNVYGLTLD